MDKEFVCRKVTESQYATVAGAPNREAGKLIWLCDIGKDDRIISVGELNPHSFVNRQLTNVIEIRFSKKNRSAIEGRQDNATVWFTIFDIADIFTASNNQRSRRLLSQIATSLRCHKGGTIGDCHIERTSLIVVCINDKSIFEFSSERRRGDEVTTSGKVSTNQI